MSDLPALALLAGGLATRMRPLTERIPKSMLAVAGKPFIDHQLALFHRRGIRKVVACIGYLGEQLHDHVGDGARWGLKVEWCFDGPKPLGTGGALRHALPYLGENFFVTYGDSWLDIPYVDVHAAFLRSGQPGLMTVYRNEGRWDITNIEFENGVIRRYDKKNRTEKMHYIDFGLQLLHRSALEDWPANESFDLASVYGRLVEHGRMAGFPVAHRFYEIGSREGLLETELLLKEGAMSITPYTRSYLSEAIEIINKLDVAQIDAMVSILADCRAKQARLFFLGVGGSAGNATHAVNDFRKIAGIEAYAPTDNVSELTARANDDGWEHIFSRWLETSHVCADDVVFVFSVGGGNLEKNISANIVEGLKIAKAAGARVIGVVGRDGGYTRKVADACVVVPTVNPETITPHTEAFHAVVWHLIVTHPDLKKNQTKWESAR